ncbi:hypothetical protein [Dyella sp.]|uniref:hypothetical protein n=1 Tax=Dyella sp. TaxID=1869338 RepID=UPI002ED41E5F
MLRRSKAVAIALLLLLSTSLHADGASGHATAVMRVSLVVREACSVHPGNAATAPDVHCNTQHPFSVEQIHADPLDGPSEVKREVASENNGNVDTWVVTF